MRILILGVGVVCYIITFYTIMALIVFIGNLSAIFDWMQPIFPFQIDEPGGKLTALAVIVNVSWVLLFAIQHSIMAREGFKKRITRLLPESLERSFFVLLASLILLGMMHFWQPIDITLWQVNHPVGQTILWILFAMGWAMLLYSSFIINHFDLFGLRQVYLAYLKKDYTHLPFQVKSLYKMVRHPLYLGFLLGAWAVPTMTLGHALFALSFTVYIFIGIHFEERDMIRLFGETYEKYRASIPKIIPFISRKR